MDVQYIAERIREEVPALEAARMLGLDVDGHGRCACPFHHGQDRNMRIYPGDRGCYCFVCHASGGTIDLVKQVNGCGFMDAVRWIDDTFRLGLDLDEKNWRSRERNAARYARRNGGGRGNAGRKHRGAHETGGVPQRERDAATGV